MQNDAGLSQLGMPVRIQCAVIGIVNHPLVKTARDQNANPILLMSLVSSSCRAKKTVLNAALGTEKGHLMLQDFTGKKEGKCTSS